MLPIDYELKRKQSSNMLFQGGQALNRYGHKPTTTQKKHY